MKLIRNASNDQPSSGIFDEDEERQTRKNGVFIAASDNPESDSWLSVVTGKGLRPGARLRARFRKKDATATLIMYEPVL